VPPTVALDVTPLVGVRTGVGVAVAQLLAALARLDDPPEVVPYALSRRARRHARDLPPGTRFPAVPAAIALRAWRRADRPRIDRALRPATVVHATNYLAPPSRLPTVVSVYDCSFMLHPEMCTPDVRAFEPVLRRAIGRGAIVHTGSHAVAGEIEALFGPGLALAGRIAVVPLGAPPPRPAPPPPDPAIDALTAGARTIVAIGRHEPRKCIPLLVQAFGRVASDRDDARLVLVGPAGPDRPAVEDALRALPPRVRARAHLAGSLDDDRRDALLHGATVLAYPSRYEGFGFPVLEAMQAGVPVVATATGAVTEVAGDAAVLVPTDDLDALAAALARVLDDGELRRSLVAAGRARGEQFSWDATAAGMAALYARATASTGGSR
jgi:glycosyltransferase involved in cell wall biosynthesis